MFLHVAVKEHQQQEQQHMKTLIKPLTPAQLNAVYTSCGTQNGKPHFTTPTKQVLSFSDEFMEKKLCTTPTLNLGMGCGFECSYCYVPGSMSRHSVVCRIQKETGHSLGDISLVRENPLSVLQKELLYADGTPRYNDHQVVFTSTLVDPCANKEILAMTMAACLLVLKHTQWTIRVLTKSAAVVVLARGLAEYKERVIYGLSTGTFDDKLALYVEKGASSPTARIRALETLRHGGYQTFGMVCPVLPQADYVGFAAEVAKRILPFVTENCWVEVINARGKAFSATIDALGKAGDTVTKTAMQAVHDDKAEWENYARATFEALSAVVPADKYRFLQYVQAGQTSWWRNQVMRGAVLLGANA